MTYKSGTSIEKAREFYDQHYYADTVRGEVSWHLRRLARRCLFSTDQRMLDVACGSGDWLQAAADRGAWVSGIDVSSKAVAVAKRRLLSGGVLVGSAERLPFEGKAFDLVSCLGALEHFADKSAALDEIHRVLRSDGKALVLVPNAGFLTRRLGLFGGTEQVAVREDVLGLEAWRRLFEQSGFSVEQRWRDLHVLSRSWLLRKGWLHAAPRLLQALLLAVWPLRWQYQVYHLLVPSAGE